MNKINYIYKYNFRVLLLVSFMLGMVACNDFLSEDPKGQLASQGFFTNKNDLDASLNALYSIVATSQVNNSFVGTNFLIGDDISTHPASNKQPLREYDQFDVSENNAWMPWLWEQRWKVIKSANFIINNADRTPEVSADEIKAAIAQAHYWRAYSYFYLVTTWGPVPITLEEEVDYDAPMRTEAEIYDQIVADLKIAEEGCPVKYTKAPYLRNDVNIAVSQGAAKATLAYVYLSMAGWPVNKGVECYKLAADKAKEVIDGVEKGTYYYKLYDDYKKIHSWEENNKNKEVLLGIFYNLDRGNQGAPATDFLLDMKQGGWGDTNGEIKFWKEFPEGPRKDATYFPKIMLNDGNLYDWWYDTEPASREVVAPVFMKSVEGAVRGTEFDYTNPAPLSGSGEKMAQTIRLSEVYCWYAEAIGRSGQINAKAVEVLNKVRNRADGAETNIYTMSMTPEELAEAAYDEHGWEIAGYYWAGFATRSQDMLRMYRYKEHFEYRKENPLIEVAPGVFLNEAVPVTGTWNDTRMYAAYPFADANLNPNFKR